MRQVGHLQDAGQQNIKIGICCCKTTDISRCQIVILCRVTCISLWITGLRSNSYNPVMLSDRQDLKCQIHHLTLILRRSHTGTVWFYTSTSNKRAARPKLYTKSLTRDLKLMYSRLTLVRISIKL